MRLSVENVHLWYPRLVHEDILLDNDDFCDYSVSRLVQQFGRSAPMKLQFLVALTVSFCISLANVLKTNPVERQRPSVSLVDSSGRAISSVFVALAPARSTADSLTTTSERTTSTNGCEIRLGSIDAKSAASSRAAAGDLSPLAATPALDEESFSLCDSQLFSLGYCHAPGGCDLSPIYQCGSGGGYSGYNCASDFTCGAYGCVSAIQAWCDDPTESQ